MKRLRGGRWLEVEFEPEVLMPRVHATIERESSGAWSIVWLVALMVAMVVVPALLGHPEIVQCVVIGFLVGALVGGQ